METDLPIGKKSPESKDPKVKRFEEIRGKLQHYAVIGDLKEIALEVSKGAKPMQDFDTAISDFNECYAPAHDKDDIAPLIQELLHMKHGAFVLRLLAESLDSLGSYSIDITPGIKDEFKPEILAAKILLDKERCVAILNTQGLPSVMGVDYGRVLINVIKITHQNDELIGRELVLTAEIINECSEMQNIQPLKLEATIKLDTPIKSDTLKKIYTENEVWPWKGDEEQLKVVKVHLAKILDNSVRTIEEWSVDWRTDKGLDDRERTVIKSKVLSHPKIKKLLG